jgi:hypothetical protein
MQIGLNTLGLTSASNRFSPFAISPDLWLDPYDLSTLYQDSAGTTAGVVGQPVGLALDKSLGLARGSELWSEGVAFVAGEASVVSPGVYRIFSSAGVNAFVANNAKLTTGKFYEVTFTIDSVASAGGGVGPEGVTTPAFTTVGRKTAVIQAISTTAAIKRASSATDIQVSGISFREIPGNHVLQATSASRPTADSTPFAGISADGFDDSMTCATGGGGTSGILICAAITVNGGAGTARYIWSDRGALVGYFFVINASNQLQLSAGNGAAFTGIATGALPVGETHVVTAWDDGSTLNVQIDNGAVNSVARPVVSAGSAGLTLFKDNSAAASFFPGDLHQLVYKKNSAGTAAERAALKTYVGAKVGIAL